MKFKFTALLAAMILVMSASAQTKSKDQKIIRDSKKAKADFISTDGLMKSLFETAHGYVIFPNVGKGGLGVGGALGNGAVYEKGKLIGMAKLTQLNIGFQAGGQAYREVVFFEDEAVLNNFRQDKIQLSAQASAVVANQGAAASAKYKNGVMVFTHVKGGLMYEASIGGQKFNFRAL